MAILKMKKLKMLVSRADKENILRELLLLGCVEVSAPDEFLEDPDLVALVERESSDLDIHKAELASITRGIDVIKQYVPVKTGMFSIKPEITGDLLLDDRDTPVCLELAKTLDSLDNKLRRLAIEENTENNLIESLMPWSSLLLPLDTEGTGTCFVMLGSISSSVDFGAMQNELHETISEAEVMLVSSDNEQHYICMIAIKSNQHDASEFLRRYGFSVTSLKSLGGTAQENIDNAKQRIADISKENTEVLEQISSAAEYRDTMQLCYDHVNTKVARSIAAENLLGTDYSLMLTGWVPEESEKALVALLSEFICAWDITTPQPDEYESVPVMLKNNALTRPLSMVTEMYSLPAYGSVDPNPPMMPFFVLFYGLMMADIGYGLVMTIAAILVKRKKPRGGMRNFFDLLLLCGISTLIVGIMTGGFFGDAPSQIASLFGAEFTMPSLFDPLNNTMEVLIGALALGVIHVIFGMGISFVKQVQAGKALDAILDIGSWWILFAGIALGALGMTWLVALLGAAMIILTGGRSSKNIFGKLAGGIGSLYNITGYFGDILSYSRVMALMLAGGVIAQVFNTLGALTGNIVTFLLIFALGHALNFGLNLLGCFVHDMRLQCLEFFGKFYEDGGRPFKPLSAITKYNNIADK